VEVLDVSPWSLIPDGPIETPPLPADAGRVSVPIAEQRDALLEVLADVTLGDYDRRIIDWLAHWDWSTVATICSLIVRARDVQASQSCPPRGQP
jgi:hypothetical protein